MFTHLSIPYSSRMNDPTSPGHGLYSSKFLLR